VTYVLADVVCAGVGMGVPVLCIALGFAVGWYVTRAAMARSGGLESIVRVILPAALATAAWTFALMAALWGPWLVVLFEPDTDYANLGIPPILFEPKASYIGWQVLMILVSPVLQLLATVFGAHVTLRWWLERRDSRPDGVHSP
jgi:hypothetical protein